MNELWDAYTITRLYCGICEGQCCECRRHAEFGKYAAGMRQSAGAARALLAKEVLKEVPGQVLQWMQAHRRTR